MPSVLATQNLCQRMYFVMGQTQNKIYFAVFVTITKKKSYKEKMKVDTTSHLKEQENLSMLL